MAEQGTTNISFGAMRTLLGVGSETSLRNLCNNSGINKWSYYRTRPIGLDGNLNVILTTAPTTNRKLGDFRRYNDDALTPKAATNYTQNWGPGGLTMTVSLMTFIERLNIHELTANDPVYFTIKFYLSSADRSAETNVKRTYTVVLDTSAETPPVDHTNDQTKAPSSSTQLVVDTAVPTDSGLVSPDDIWYCDTYISDISGNAIIRFDDGYTEVNTHEQTDPYVSLVGDAYTFSGYTTVLPIVNNHSSNCLGADRGMTFGSQNGDFFFHIVGLQGGTWYRLACTATIELRVPGQPNTPFAIYSGSMSGTANRQTTTTDFWGSSNTWDYDDIGKLTITALSGVSNGTSGCNYV